MQCFHNIPSACVLCWCQHQLLEPNVIGTKNESEIFVRSLIIYLPAEFPYESAVFRSHCHFHRSNIIPGLQFSFTRRRQNLSSPTEIVAIIDLCFMQPPLSNFRLPLPAPEPTSQIVIVGTHAARTKFLPELHHALHVHEKCLLVDIHVLPAMYHHPTWRYIAIVSNASELYTFSTVRPDLGDRLVIFAVPQTLTDAVSIRLAAVKHLHTPGVIIINQGTRAKTLFYDLIRVWRAKSDNAALQNVWGEPAFEQKYDIVLPPHWDNEAKIQAVIDAYNLRLDDTNAVSGWGTLLSPPHFPVHVDSEEMRADADRKQRAFIQDHNAWLKNLSNNSTSDNKAHVDSKGASVEKTSSAHSPAKADFFQRLLARGNH